MINNTSSEKDQIKALLQEAYLIRVSDLQTSLRKTNEALERSRRLNDQSLIAECYSRQSLFYMILGEYERSTQIGKEALAIFKSINDQRGIADVKYNIAGTYYKTDNYHLGLIYLIDSLEIYRQLEDYHNQSRVQKSLGTIYEYFGDEKSAVMAYEGAIEAGKKVGDKNLISNALNPLSGIYLSRGEIEKADDIIDQSIQMKRETKDIRGLAFALYGKAKVHVKRKEYDIAERIYHESIDIHMQMGERLGAGMCYHKLAVLYLELDMLEKAEVELLRGLDFSQEYNIAIIKFKCNYLMYTLYKRRGDANTALTFLEKYLKEKEGVINTQTQKVIESYEAITTMERLHKEAQMEREKAEIVKKKNRAEEASRIKQEFLSTMSHEIRTPLNAVITITSLLAEKYQSDKEGLLNSLQFSANNLLRIINDILDFSKLDAGKVDLDFESVELAVLLEEICNTYRSLAVEKGIRLLLNIDPALNQNYSVDQTKLSQILGNLISNAIKFTDQGHVTVAVDLAESGEEWDRLKFTVTDTGGGIQDNFLNEIFESFSQPKSFITKKHGGSGLGLAIVKKLVELHNGTIQVATEVGKGSQFFFEISYKRTDVSMIRVEHKREDLNGLKVLIAEDNMINAMVAQKLLSKWGLITMHAKDGLEAVEMAGAESYDYILMDIHMPEKDGFEATLDIRSNAGPNSNTPIFALTADITAHQKNTYANLFSGFLLKPIEQQKMYQALISYKKALYR